VILQLEHLDFRKVSRKPGTSIDRVRNSLWHGFCGVRDVTWNGRSLSLGAILACSYALVVGERASLTNAFPTGTVRTSSVKLPHDGTDVARRTERLENRHEHPLTVLSEDGGPDLNRSEQT